MKDKMIKELAILTPTYNRAYILPILYKSLLQQTNFNFCWYIIDDGSTDDTEKLCEEFKTDKFPIVYMKKENGGKHTALNTGISIIEEELTFIVDSDDYLTENAVETILIDWNLYRLTKDVVGLSYYRVFKNGKTIGDGYSGDCLIGTYAEVRINNKVQGDKAEVYQTEILKKYPFPVFKGEKFLSEAITWNKISKDGYKLVYIPKGIYICEYIEDGLTKAGRKKMFLNPLGYLEHAKSYLYKGIKRSIQWKYTIMYIAVAALAKVSWKKVYKETPMKLKFILAYPFGRILGFYWRHKYA